MVNYVHRPWSSGDMSEHKFCTCYIWPTAMTLRQDVSCLWSAHFFNEIDMSANYESWTRC